MTRQRANRLPGSTPAAASATSLSAPTRSMGGSVAGGLFGGIALSKFVDAEIELMLPADPFTRSYTGRSVSFAPPGSSRAERERLSVITRFDKEREVTSSLSGVVIIHPPATERVTPGLIVGVANQRVRDRATYTPVSIPEGVDPQHPVGHRPHRVVDAQHRRPDVRRQPRDRADAAPVDRPRRALRLRLDRRRDQQCAPDVGADAVAVLTRCARKATVARRLLAPATLATGVLSAFINARGAPPPLALARRLRAALGPQALPSHRPR